MTYSNTEVFAQLCLLNGYNILKEYLEFIAAHREIYSYLCKIKLDMNVAIYNQI